MVKPEQYKNKSLKYVCIKDCWKKGVGDFYHGEIISNEELIEIVKDDPNFEIHRED
jgi:hypothetical protein